MQHNGEIRMWLEQNDTAPSDLCYGGPFNLDTAPSLSIFDQAIKSYNSDILNVSETLWSQFHASEGSEREIAQQRVDFLGCLLEHRGFLIAYEEEWQRLESSGR